MSKSIGKVSVEVDAVVTDERYRECMELLRAANERMDAMRAENDALREQCHYLKKGDILHVLTDQEYIDQCKRERLMQVSINALDKENVELRELCRDMWEIIGDFEETPYVKERHGNNPAVTLLDEDWEPIEECKRRIRELGIEVGQ